MGLRMSSFQIIKGLARSARSERNEDYRRFSLASVSGGTLKRPAPFMGNTAAPPESITREGFRWKPAEPGPEVLLRWSVMGGIEAEVMEGFKALPRRGAEIGGALLGSRGPRGEFLIDSWLPIPIEHRSGPSYILSDADLFAWAESVKQARAGAHQFIGIYRSQTRPGFGVTPDDCIIVEKFLPREDGVLLIVKPLSILESVATFYFCDGGAIVDAAAESREFEFGGKAIPPGALVEPQSGGEGAIGPDLAPRENRATGKSPAARLNARGAWRRWASVVLPASAIAVGAAFGYYAHYAGGSGAENPVPSAAAAPSSISGLDLRAERTPEGMRLTWNSQAPVLSDATEGVLLIDDAGSRVQQRLAPEELRAGSLTWRPASNQTEFEIRVISGSGREYAESIRVVQPPE
jgi:hypothetical protein